MADKAGQRVIGPAGLLFAGIGSLIGSGWLFGPWHTAELAGPGAVFAWLIAAAMIAVIAATFAELGVMFPETGGAVRYAFLSHGTLVGLVAAWANWVAIVTVAPVEAEATVQYMATWPVAWAHGLFAGGELSTPGIAVAAALTVGYFLLNAFGVRWYLRANGVLTVFKLVVPLLTGAALLVAARHPANLAAGVAPGAPPLRLPSILGAAATSGIIFSLSGFQTPINLAGEARDPGRTLPIGVFGSLAIAVVIYLVLQVAFLLATPAGMVAKGWGGVTFSSPFAELATKVGLPWLAVLLYIDAVASPTGTGATYTATTARIVIAGQRSGTLPGVLGQERGSARVPRPAVWLDLLVGFGFLLCFRGWSALAAVISVACILSFVAGPIAVTTLRRTAPDVERPFRLPAVRLVAGAAFVCATLLLYWARWPTTGEVLLLVAGAAPVWLWAERRAGWRETRRHLCAAAWLLAYMPAMALLSFLGSREFGGRDLVPFGPDLVLVALTGAVFFLWGTRSGYRTAALAERNGERRARPDAVRA